MLFYSLICHIIQLPCGHSPPPCLQGGWGVGVEVPGIRSAITSRHGTNRCGFLLVGFGYIFYICVTMAHNSVKHWDNYPPQNLRKSTKKSFKIAKKHGSEDSGWARILPKSSKNVSKITENPGFEGSGGLWGEVWEPWWSPGGPRSPKIAKNHVRGTPWDPPLGVHCRHFLRFFGVFLWTCSRTFFYGFFY